MVRIALPKWKHEALSAIINCRKKLGPRHRSNEGKNTTATPLLAASNHR